MSAADLRTAAAEIREDIRLGIRVEDAPLFAALADLFDSTVREHFDVDCGENCTTRTYPIEAVARAYLGEPDPAPSSGSQGPDNTGSR